jgi:hypothetical protein
MKKNNVLFTSVFAVIILISTVVILSCELEDANAAKGKVFYDPITKTSLSLENQAELNRIATILAKEKEPITILTDAYVADLTDSKGDFKAISVAYQVGESMVKMMVPISEVSVDQVDLKSGKAAKGPTYYMVQQEACEMKCTSVAPCTVCTQEIIERCKSQTCTCSSGSTGCNASITFPAN